MTLIITEIIPLLTAFTVLLIGSLTDLKTREVPDWINYGLIGSGLLLNALMSILYLNYSFILNSIIGFSIFFVVAWIMFYTGQWGGGDSKMLMGLGAVIGLDLQKILSLDIGNIFLISFFINTLISGAVYGLLFTVYLAVKNKKSFSKEYAKLNKNKKIRIIKLSIASLFLISIILFFIIKDFYFRFLSVSLAVLLGFSFYMWLFIKIVEKSSMFKLVEPEELTEGDWIAKEIKIGGKYITGPKDLGIEKPQIKELIKLKKQKKIKKILIKEGIPFVPSFLIAFIITFFFGNLILLLF